jgi:hypothetical protein
MRPEPRNSRPHEQAAGWAERSRGRLRGLLLQRTLAAAQFLRLATGKICQAQWHAACLGVFREEPSARIAHRKLLPSRILCLLTRGLPSGVRWPTHPACPLLAIALAVPACDRPLAMGDCS